MTVDNGALLHGIGGDDPTRPDPLRPLDLAGGVERIDFDPVEIPSQERGGPELVESQALENDSGQPA